MNAFDDLYQEIVLDHYRSPRNKARLDNVPESMVHENPSCGDSIKLEVSLGDDGILKGIRFDGRGCAISTASASLMTEKLKGLTVGEARSLAESFIRSLRGESPVEALDDMGDLAAFKGVSQFPVRVKCATLAWHALLLSLPLERDVGAAPSAEYRSDRGGTASDGTVSPGAPGAQGAPAALGMDDRRGKA